MPRHHHTAVDRNRLKRRLRELVRVELLPALRAQAAIDVAIRTRHQAYGAELTALRADIRMIQSRVATGAALGSAASVTDVDAPA